MKDNGKIVRYEKRIYYIPKEPHFGHAIGPSPKTIARYKHISRMWKTDGYYSVGIFANLIGISLQVPHEKRNYQQQYRRHCAKSPDWKADLYRATRQ